LPDASTGGAVVRRGINREHDCLLVARDRVGQTDEALNVGADVQARGAIHIQNVNGWQARFKIWLIWFRGVASRYLAHYAGWQRVLDARRPTSPGHLLQAAAQLA
jgi:hypothetical protein